MSIPSSIFGPIEAFSGVFDTEDLLESRFENDVNGNPIYIGYTPVVNGDTSLPIWYIRKIIYDGENVIRTQLPDDGIKFSYIWDDRADYFEI